jgi:hypothetical protein
MNRNDEAPPVVPILSAGRHRSPKRGACFMEFASYLAGEPWSDHPTCTHPLLAALARDVNDQLSDARRSDLAPFIHRVVGLTSDDPLAGAMIATRAAIAALPIASMDRQCALAVALIGLRGPTDGPSLHPTIDAALAEVPHAARWALEFIESTRVSPHDHARSEAAIVHASVTAIAEACVSDAQDRLVALLVDMIESLERDWQTIAAVEAPQLQRA